MGAVFFVMKLDIAMIMFITLDAFLAPVVSQFFLPEDAILDFNGLARKYGYKTRQYDLTTEDGYILRMFRIPGNKTKPVLLTHGIMDSADSFILRGRNSLAAILSDEGYDVWVGNNRGNKYSRRHETLDPDTDKEFWSFSFHEMAVFDLRSFIDLVLEENNVTSVSVIGHSQGNTLFYTLGSTIPEYNDKIRVAIALAPVVYINEDNIRSGLSTILTVAPLLNMYLEAADIEEIFSDGSLLTQFKNSICSLRRVGYTVCAEGIFYPIAGEDMEEMEPEFFYILIGHFPTSTSRKGFAHFLQIAKRNTFAQYDYGSEKNLAMYNSQTPPLYDLSKVTMKVAMMIGANDHVTPMENVELLRDQLPNVVSFHVMEREKINHMDFIWGKHMNEYLFPIVNKILVEYT